MSVRAAVAAVGEIRHPRLRLTLGELGCVRRSLRHVLIELVPGDEPFRTDLESAALRAAGATPIEFGSGDVGRRRNRVQELRRSAPSPGSIGSPTQVVLVGSGKGGVGKSSISANLAVTLARIGYTVGLLDADVWGYSVPSMLGVDRRPVSGSRIVPPMAHGVRVLSTESFLPPNEEVVVWRGPMLHQVIEQFVREVDWGGPDFLVVDLPPGTGDVSISIAEMLPDGELLLVTTPQAAAAAVALRAARFGVEVGLPVVGVIENFSWFQGDDGVRYTPFGAGGGERLASELGVDLLAQLPLVTEFRAAVDEGRPVEAGGELAGAFERLALKLVERLPRKRRTPDLNVG